MGYQSKTFSYYENTEMNAWMLCLSVQGFKLVNFKAIGNNSVIIFMEK